MNTSLDQRSVEKWGEAGKGGFQLLPDILFKKQVELGLSPTDMLVLMNLTMHWWYAHQRPFPHFWERVKYSNTPKPKKIE